jgi:N-glycosylase/DNA lyase
MPATYTSHGSVHDRLPLLAPGVALARAERAGLTTSRVLAERSGASRSEPVGQQVELVIAGDLLRFAWGHPWELGTAAYWAHQTRELPFTSDYALGKTLAEELAACVLGGHGVPAAVGLAAFYVVRDEGLLDGVPTAVDLEKVLRAPLAVPGRRRPVHYRFPAQRAHRLAAALAVLADAEPPREPLRLRSWLLGLPGIGPKTASWIVRNHCGCDDVAIVDVHVRRAGLAAGFFRAQWRLPRDYLRFELAFCEVAQLAGIPTSTLDACIWGQLQALGPAGALLLARE